MEIAFFGGSFTGIDRGLMIRLLELAERYVEAGSVCGIRLSTRPDMIDQEVLGILKGYTISQIELGLQSLSDPVLLASRRGHTADCAREACRRVVDAGFSMVGQMMIGLPSSREEDEIATAEEIVQLGADACRIYPTVVFHNTPLAQMTRQGDYVPLSLEDAVRRTARAMEVFLQSGVDCLRIGLCASEELTAPEQVLAGPNHPALGELVWNEIYYKKIYDLLVEQNLLGREVELTVSRRETSKAVGQHRCNLQRLERETGTRVQRLRCADEGEALSVTSMRRN